jgi:hypothetical protein
MNVTAKRRGRPPRPPEPRTPEPHERQEFADRLQAILGALEIGDLAKEVRLYLQKMLRRLDLLRAVDAKRFPTKGDEEVTLLLRTVFESSNGAAALTLPILRAVSSCMHARWTGQGLAWIEAFDAIDLRAILLQARELDIFRDEEDLEHHLSIGIRNRLRKILGPEVVPQPKPQKPPARPKLARPAGVSEETWAEIVALRKKPRTRSGRQRRQERTIDLVAA